MGLDPPSTCEGLHSATGETANLMNFRRELRFSDQLQDYPRPDQREYSNKYVISTKDCQNLAHKELYQLLLQMLPGTRKSIRYLL